MSRRDLRNEADYLPTSIDDLADLHGRLVDAGHSTSVASGICSWLALKAAAKPDTTDSTTRARYRKILAELAPAPSPEPSGPPTRPSLALVGSSSAKRRDRGKGGKALTAVVLAGAAALGVGTHAKPAQAASAAPGPVSEHVSFEETPRILVSSRNRRRSVKLGARWGRRAA